MDQQVGLQKWLKDRRLRDALKRDLEEGTPCRRLSVRYNPKEIKVFLNDQNTGIFFTPPPTRPGRNNILFQDITKLSKFFPGSKIHKRAKLSGLEYCLQIETSSGITLHLVLKTKEELSTWHGFFYVESKRHVDSLKLNPTLAYMNAKWGKANKVGDSIDFPEAHRIVHSTFRDIAPDTLNERFREHVRPGDKRLDRNGFLDFFASFCEYPALIRPYKEAVQDPKEGMTKAEFTAFLHNQGDLGDLFTSPSISTPNLSASDSGAFTASSSMDSPSSQSRYSSLVNGIFASFGLSESGRLHLWMFAEIVLFSREHSVCDSRHQRAVDPMDKPLHCYYINSSHNTYLCGDQLRSESSIERYRDVLLSGCRCVEIDCWDGPDGEPIVYHGYTMTSKILFEDVVQAINKYAFADPTTAMSAERPRHCEWNPRLFPVILSLEVHTSEAQSNRMAEILRTVLGDKLLLPGVYNDVRKYTPNNLRGKILAKWKANEDGDEDVKDRTGDGISDKQPSLQEVLHTSKALSACVTVGAIKTKVWGEGVSRAIPSVQSYVESAVDSLYNQHAGKFQLQNTRMLGRVYPGGHRVASGNYDPVKSWRLGAHMVALNFQTRDTNMLVNQGFFEHRNGGCGYVLKPEYLRNESLIRADVTGPPGPSKPFTLKVELIGGTYLDEACEGDQNTRRRVEMWLNSDDKKSSKSSNVCGCSFSPLWNEKFVFSGDHQELDVLCVRLLVSDPGKTEPTCTVAEFAVSVKVMKTGYRTFPLKSPRGDSYFNFASLFCHVSFS